MGSTEERGKRGIVRETSPAYPAHTPQTGRLTYSDYANLPSDGRYELIEGEISVPPAPNTAHQRLLGRLLVSLSGWVDAHDLGEVFVAPYDVVLDDWNVVQPDILFVSRKRSALVTEANLRGAPDLAIEVLSPGDESRDRVSKRAIYARCGVTEYWIVDPLRREIELLHREPTPSASLRTLRVYSGDDSLRSMVVPDFVLNLTHLFDGIGDLKHDS